MRYSGNVSRSLFNEHNKVISLAGLYLHIPFCEHKCIYCDFYSIENLQPMEKFGKLLQREIQLYHQYSNRQEFDTIFFGGGTPSLLSPSTMGEILQTLHTTFRVTQDAEITIEANPGTVDKHKLTEYRKLGINRLSFGVQSFHQDDLQFLTRIHTAEEARRAVADAQEAGFDNINVDLIFSLPKQTLKRWEENLRQAVALNTQHISAYSLIVEQNTPLARMVQSKQVNVLSPEIDAQLFETTMEYLPAHGFEQYEVSNYAKAGLHSRHNLNYWTHGNYLGFGPSAHSFFSGRRWWNIANLRTYSEKLTADELPVAGEETLTDEQLIDETVMLGLRSRGIDLVQFKKRFGIDLTEGNGFPVEDLLSEKLAVVDNMVLRLTSKGFLLCDEISRRLLSNCCPA